MIEDTFNSKLAIFSDDIRASFRSSKYDHKAFLPDNLDPEKQETKWMMSENFRVGYACFKREVARVIQPKIIVEFGVGIGISAMAFLDTCKSATYIGYDNDCEEDSTFPVRPSKYVSGLLEKAGIDGRVIISDTMDIGRVPKADLAHIDAGHSYGDTLYNCMLAWRSGCEWILVDDCIDSTVAAATLACLSNVHAGDSYWAYFENTWTGNILIHNKRKVANP